MPTIKLCRQNKTNPKSAWLNAHAKDENSQFGEDGILAAIFSIIGTQNRWCVEAGAWDGKLYSNTHSLMREGWNGVLIEGNKEKFPALQATYHGNRSAHLVNALIGLETDTGLDAILVKTPIPTSFDLLSLDIDGCDYFVWEELKRYTPRVVVIEFNPTVPNDVLFIQDRTMSRNQGCSLLALIEIGKAKGYELVVTTAVNGIFVRADEFSKFHIEDNSIDAMHDPMYSSRIFQGYDGTIFTAGMDYLLWSQRPVQFEELQVLKPEERRFADAPGANIANMPWKESLPLIGRLSRRRAEWRRVRSEYRETTRRLHEALRERDQLLQEREAWIAQHDALFNDVSRFYAEPPADPRVQSVAVHAQFLEFLDMIHPADLAGGAKVRVGGPHDGGYVMIDDFAVSRTAISLGVGVDASWDTDLAGRGIRVLQFDDTIETAPVSNSRFAFQKKRVVARSSASAEISLADILEMSGVADDHDLIMKMDIEGAEWDVLGVVPGEHLSRLRQIVVEFHWLHNFALVQSWRDHALAAVRNLARTHQVVHVHGNNHAGFAVVDGIPFPDVFELTFIRRDRRALSRSYRNWPTELDAPNRPGIADLAIHTFARAPADAITPASGHAL